MAVGQHKAQAPSSVSCFILTVSDTRTAETDTSGRTIRSLLEDAGHSVSGTAIVKDDPGAVAAIVEAPISSR